MTLGRFWAIVEASRKEAGGSNTDAEQERFLAGLRGRLKRLSLEQLRAFHRTQRRLHHAAYRWDLWGAADLMSRGCSDDGFEYFRQWLMAQGRKVWEEALTCPDSLADHVAPGMSMYSFEELLYVATLVFEERTNGCVDIDDDPAHVMDPIEPTGSKPRRDQFPRLRAVCRRT